MQTLSDSNFDSVLDGSPRAVVLFSASWCGPCKTFKPKFLKMADEMSDVDFFYCDVDEAQKITMDLAIQSVPTIITFKSGDTHKHIVGADETRVRAMLEELRTQTA